MRRSIRLLLVPLALVLGLLGFLAFPALADDEPAPAASESASASESESAEPSEHAESEEHADHPAASASASSDEADYGPTVPDDFEGVDQAAKDDPDLPDLPLVPMSDLVPEADAIKAHLSKDPKDYAEFARKMIEKAREKVVTKMEEKAEEKSAAKMEKLATILGCFSFSAILLLLLPFVMSKKYPGKMGVLFKYSAIAAVVCFFVINLFAGVLLVLRGAQATMGKMANPTVMMVDATFDTLSDNVEHMMTFGPQLIEPTMRQIAGEKDGGDGDEGQPQIVLLENVKRMKGDFSAHIAVAKFFKSIKWVFEYVPIATTIITLLLFALSARPIITGLVSLPAKAASGDEAAAKGLVKQAFLHVWNELKAVAGLIGALVVITMISGTIMSEIVRPGIEAFLDYFFASLIYIQEDKAASSGVVQLSLISTIVFLAINLATLILASSFFLGKVHKILQHRFHDGVPLKAHAKFWKWGVLGVLWVMLFPWLYMLAALPIVQKFIDESFEKGDKSWTFIMLSGPLTLVGAYLVLFWAARGLKAITFIFKYKPKAIADEYKKTASSAPPMPANVATA